jgi:hypothetical protein
MDLLLLLYCRTYCIVHQSVPVVTGFNVYSNVYFHTYMMYR